MDEDGQPLPGWDDRSLGAGSMIRAALWLVQVVGIGNTFTKRQLRDAFPEVAQIDRRVRDLRKYAWVLHANTEDASLTSEEQRLVSVGVPVWDSAARRAASANAPVSAKDKAEALARDGFMCTTCGISGGEPYPEDVSQTALLGVARREALVDGEPSVGFFTVCQRCRAGERQSAEDVDGLLGLIRSLDQDQRATFAAWVAVDQRRASPIDIAWARFRRLPADAQSAIRAELG